MPFYIHSHGASDPGLVRTNNEDSWFASPDYRIFFVADGLGGHQAGEVASREAVETFVSLYVEDFFSNKAENLSEDQIKLRLQKCFEIVNQRLHTLSGFHDLLKGMGTTFCGLTFHDSKVAVSHIGDSRIYLHRNGELTQLTKDHCSTQPFSLIPYCEGPLPKGYLTRALGTMDMVEPSIQMIPFEAHDCFLLCTDGLSDMLSNYEIESIINRPMTIGERVRMLIAQAKQKGGADNITLILVEVAP